MEYIKEKIMTKEKKISNLGKNSNYFPVKVNNSCHLFNISFVISKRDSIPKEYYPKTFNNIIEPKFMIIKADLINKDEHYFNNNNEEIEISQKYYETYTLDELKNNTKGLEWFSELTELKDAFIESIKNNNFELLVVKNILLFSINIKNPFGFSKNCHLVLRPYKYIDSVDNNKGNNSISIEILDNKKNAFFEKHKKVLFNDENINNNICNNQLLNKKINKKHLKKKILDKDKDKKIQLNKSINSVNSEQKSKKENNLNEMLNFFLQNLEKNKKSNLPEFNEESLLEKSTILQNSEEEKLIKDMISNFKSKKFRLLFRATRDGDSANKFHSICDNYKNLIVLIETIKGYRFGGFTSNKFKGYSHYKFDNNAFLFSLDNKKVYNIIAGQYAIYCYENSGPCFAQESLYIPNNFFKKCGKTGKAGGPYQFEKDYEINNGEQTFIVKELEIFQVKIEDN